MDDSDCVCPLCCEELDLSDREFYPCKCGYQVCMWCWHRIRETESGLCPACRTPYGDDPHQFTAVDVEKVLKANKEKEAAAKRDRQQRNSTIQIPTTLPHPSQGPDGNRANSNSPTEQGGENHFITGEVPMDIPKDRTLLANMRVIRRNLVYAVGLPPAIATEDILRKPEYFGQYGKIAKIVLNRSQATVGDPRRASASAYVTFVHKEDTLACILAMDGFNMDGRNIRASYGTSKYCSAFIKNVRCNNPDCTYLHEMGAAEDTFTKQEIQAGYVTSGRDVLARQQQIVQEQLRLAGAGLTAPRKRIGGGGPSATGKASPHPVFPPPEFDEPSKPAPTLVPPPTSVGRSSTTTGITIPGGVPLSSRSRTSSIGSKSPREDPTPAGAAAMAAPLPAVQRKPAVSAASVVAGVHTLSRPDPLEPHSTLTPLTPLKRSSTKSTRVLSTGDAIDKLTPARGVAKKKNGAAAISGTPAPATAPPAAPQPPAPEPLLIGLKPGLSSIGGDPIGPPAPIRSCGVTSLGGDPVGPELQTVGSASSLLGGDVYTGHLPKPTSAIGSGKDKWNAIEDIPVATPGTSAAPLWSGTNGHHGGPSLAPRPSLLAPSSGVIGGSRAPGPSGINGNSSSALASILGINLPTGSGTLQDTSSWWTPVSTVPAPTTPSPLSSLNSGSVPVQGNVIGGVPVGMGGTGSSLIGGVPIGGGGMGSGSSSFGHGGAPGTIGAGNRGSTKSDIALLQSLLPGVHITSGADTTGFGTIGSWNNGGRSGPSSLNGDAIAVGTSNSWGGGVVAREQGSAVGTIGGNAIHQQSHRGSGIW